jgi:hypothetical protein
MNRRICIEISLSLLVMVTAGCETAVRHGPVVPIRYVGSSTVANFLRDAEPIYGNALSYRTKDEASVATGS